MSHRNPRVLHVSTAADGGGAAKVARALHDRLGQRDVQSTLLCGLGQADPGAGVVTLGTPPWRHVGNALLQRLSGREGVLNHRAWEEALARHLERADVVHLHNAHGYYLPRAILERILRRPTVWTLHDEWLLTGRCAFPLDCNGYLEGCRPCPHLRRYPAAWIDRAAAEHPRRRRLAAQANAVFVTPSAVTRDRFVAAGFPASRFRVIHNPLQFEDGLSTATRLQARRELDLPEDKTVLLFVAAETWVPRKGIDIFAAATRRLVEPEVWQLCVVGAVDREVQRMFAAHPVANRLAGPVDDRRLLATWYRAADALVAPSRGESFGLIVVEAAAMGCRVVCSDLPVFRELLGEQGLYFPPGDDLAAARAIGALRGGGDDDPLLLVQARTIRERFSLDRIVDQYLAAYNSARSEPPASEADQPGPGRTQELR